MTANAICRPSAWLAICFKIQELYIHMANERLLLLTGMHAHDPSSLGLVGLSSLGLVGLSSLGLVGLSSLGLVGLSSLGLVGLSSLGLVGLSSLGLVG